jgi:hypothetical protein
MHIILFAIGLVILVYVLLSYEDEQKKVNNILEDVWIKLYDSERNYSQRLLDFLHATATLVTKLLARFYGDAHYSSRAFFASASMCLGSGIVFILLFIYWLKDMGVSPELLGLSLSGGTIITWCCVSLLLIATPALISNAKVIAASFLLSVGYAVYKVSVYVNGMVLTYSTYMPQTAQGEEAYNWQIIAAIWAISIIVVSSLLDYICIAYIRKRSESSASARSTIKYSANMLASIVFSIAMLFVLPIIFYIPYIIAFIPGSDFSAYILTQTNNPSSLFHAFMSIYPIISESVSYTYLFNMFPVILSFLFFFIITISLAYSAIWAVIPRSVYAVLKSKIHENKKTLIALSLALIGLSFPVGKNILEGILKYIV